jgi:protein involved in polysaccharide export with SLBB domain
VIALAGLNVAEAAIRIGADRSLRSFNISVTLLPLEPVGVDALQPFGYDLFQRPLMLNQYGYFRTRFQPSADIPVPGEYVIGPGDGINVQLFGNISAEYAFVVAREGTISIPEIGPIAVGGLSVADMREVISQQISEQMIGVRSNVTLGELRSVRIFVVGDIERPGSYTVSGLSTITNALFASGGITEIGSLRKVELKRDGETVSTLDLYDLILEGDTSNDVRLLPGDVVLVPPVGDTVTVGGMVRRPAIYELAGETNVGEIVALAGGLRPTADRTLVKLERVVPGRGVSVSDVDLTDAAGSIVDLRDGDVVRVFANLDLLERSVRLDGNVYQPGIHEWRDGMYLTDLVQSPEHVKPMSDLNYVLIRREIEPNVFIEVLSADLQRAWQAPGGPDDIELRPRDTVYIFNLEIGRAHVVVPLLEDIRAQTPSGNPVPVARIGGQVRAPGEYPLEPGMRVSDLLRAGGGLTESAYVQETELTRYEIVEGEYRETAFVSVDLAAVMRGEFTADLPVTSHDYFNVREVPQWRDQQSVELLGEITFPGVYQIRQGETLSSVLARAGGLTQHAFPEGGVFLREDLRDREREQLRVLASRLESELASISLASQGVSDTLTVGQSLVEQLRNAEPSGRLVINLQNITRDSNEDIVLKHGDRLLVPETTQSVTVLGEVQYPTSHLYGNALDRDGYIARSGGFTARADRGRTYIVRANGEVVARRSRWFSSNRREDIHPGDTIVVPMDISTGQRLSFWGSVTQIIYNLAIAAAAVDSFGQ